MNIDKSNPLLDANKLYEAGNKTIKSSSFKHATQAFEINQLLEIAKLKNKIENHKYKPSKPIRFVLRERGKIRDVAASNMVDKVVNHCLCDEIITPAIKPYLIYANCSSQKGKGVGLQRDIIRKHLQKYYMENGNNDGYILLMDFTKYYANINHDISKKMLCNKVNPDEMTRYIIDEIYAGYNDGTDGMGVNIGNQVSQDIGILHPYLVDNYFTIVLGNKYYGRYTDDSYAIFKTKEEAKIALKTIKEITESLGIVLHKNKTRIISLNKPFYFLKIKYQLYDNGKVRQIVHKSAIIREKRKLKRYAIKLKNGSMTMTDIDNAFKSWLGSYAKYMYAWQLEDIGDFYIKLYGRIPKWKKNRSKLYYLMTHKLKLS